MNQVEKPYQASDPYKQSDISFEDMNQVSQANPQAGRIMQSQQAGQQVQGAERFFDQYRQAEKNTAALNTARTELSNNADVIKFKARNFDQSEALKSRMATMTNGVSKQWTEAETNFSADKAGRQFLSERQLEDWMNLKGAKDQDWQNYSQAANIASDRRMQILQSSYKTIEMADKQATAMYGQQVTQQWQTYVAKAQAALKKKELELKNSSARRGVMVSGFTAVGTGVGAVVGGVVGTVAGGMTVPGAIAGGAIGGMAGGFLGGAVADSQGD